MNFQITSFKFLSNNHLGLQFAVENFTDLEFAYYVIKDGERLQTIWYQPLSTTQMKLEFKPEIPGVYKFRVFIKDQHENKLAKMSSEIIVSSEMLQVVTDNVQEIPALSTHGTMIFHDEKCPRCGGNSLEVHEDDISGRQERYCKACDFVEEFNWKHSFS